MNLGKKVEPAAPLPKPEWQPYKPGMEIGPGGALRTCIPLPPPKPLAEQV